MLSRMEWQRSGLRMWCPLCLARLWERSHEPEVAPVAGGRAAGGGNCRGVVLPRAAAAGRQGKNFDRKERRTGAARTFAASSCDKWGTQGENHDVLGINRKRWDARAGAGGAAAFE